MAKKDLIIGGASGYNWDQLKYWVNSINMSGFEGDIIIVSTNISKETIDILTKNKVSLALYGIQQPDGSCIPHKNGAPHVERFFYMWNTLKQFNPHDYRYVISTDTRDVIFQADPVKWLKENTILPLVAASEGMIYRDEPWGNNNMLQTFGPFFHKMMEDKTIYNVGTIAGQFSYVRDLFLMIFQMSINRPIPIVDQAVYNFLIEHEPYNNITDKVSNDCGWACQLGTTKEAILAGKGDIGILNQEGVIDYGARYHDAQPIFSNEKVINYKEKLFTIVHQYDRIPHLKEHIERVYG